MSEKIEFCNGMAPCGCRLDFLSGGGEYSDSAVVHLCDLHQPTDGRKQQIDKRVSGMKMLGSGRWIQKD